MKTVEKIGLALVLGVVCLGVYATYIAPPAKVGDTTTQVVAVSQNCIFAVCEQTANFDVVGGDVIEQPTPPPPTQTPAPPAPAKQSGGSDPWFFVLLGLVLGAAAILFLRWLLDPLRGYPDPDPNK